MRLAAWSDDFRWISSGLGRATVGNTSRIRADAHRVENAADHAYKTAKHLEEATSF